MIKCLAVTPKKNRESSIPSIGPTANMKRFPKGPIQSINPLLGTLPGTKHRSNSASIIQHNQKRAILNETITGPLNFENINYAFDNFIISFSQEPFSVAIEKAFQNLYHSKNVNCWFVIGNNMRQNDMNFFSNPEFDIKMKNETTFLYSQSTGKFCEIEKCLMKHCFSNFDNVIYMNNPMNESDFNNEVDLDEPTFLIPILNPMESSLFAIIQIGIDKTRIKVAEKQMISIKILYKKEYKFDNDDAVIDKNGNNLLIIALKFAEKLKLYSHFFSTPDKIIPKYIKNFGNASISEILHQITKLFDCSTAELWGSDTFNTCVMKYSELSGKFVPVGKKCGIVNLVFKHSLSNVNITNVKNSPEYIPEIDGKDGGSALIREIVIDESTFPYNSKIVNKQLGFNYALILRGKNNNKSFNALDEHILFHLVPLMAKIIAQSQYGPNRKSKIKNKNPDDADFAKKLTSLLEVAELLSGVLDIDRLIPTIMERACTLLNSERCSLFIVDPSKTLLITRFHGGLNKSIKIPLSKGIAGYTATTGNIVNIENAYEDPRFDKQMDLTTGYKTKTILAVPIYNNRGEIAGVTEMINKHNNQIFNESDIKMLMAFNVFCGISLDNARLYQTSLDLTRQLRGFVEISSALVNNTNIQLQSILEQILNSTKEFISAKRASIFMIDKNHQNELITLANVGSEIQNGSIFAKEMLNKKNKNPIILSREEIFVLIQSKSDKSLDGMILNIPRSLTRSKMSASSLSAKMSRINSALVSEKNDENESNNWIESICEIPLLSSTCEMVGILELESTGGILQEDLKLLDCFAVFASVMIERSELKELAEIGYAEVQIKKYLTDEERKEHNVPKKMVIDKNNIFTINFDSTSWIGIGHFKVLWAIVTEFDLLNEFNITNERWFHFIIEISQTYKKVPYHNWIHAVDVCQFATYEIHLAKLDQRLTKFELLGFIVSAICHDANHDGFTNVYNEKAETPLGILFKNQSVMETHHCTVAISVLSKEECNIFSALTAEQYKKMWNLIFQLILITDMAKHFSFLKLLNEDLDRDGPYDEKNEENRLKMMQLILKCADISNVSRPFELADKWCDVLCEEFFRQGDLEMANGMEYTSPLNDREHLDKPKSQIGFYTFVCLPLYQLAARVFPELQVNVDQVQSNLAIWKKATESNSK